MPFSETRTTKDKLFLCRVSLINLWRLHILFDCTSDSNLISLKVVYAIIRNLDNIKNLSCLFEFTTNILYVFCHNL